jgi:hypothetical protein
MAAEHRAKQKVLALQEAIKRAQATTTEMETLVLEVEDALPQLQIEKKDRGREYETLLAEAERVRGYGEGDGDWELSRISKRNCARYKGKLRIFKEIPMDIRSDMTTVAKTAWKWASGLGSKTETDGI